MSDSKGKRKVQASKEVESESGVADSINNLLSDVASSASGLAKSAFTAPSSNELSNASNSAALGSGKVQSSSSEGAGSSAYAESSKPTTSTSSSNGQTSTSSQPQGLRTQQAQHAATAESEFSSFLDTIPPMESDTFSMEPLDGQYTAQPASQPSPSSYTGTGTDYPHPSSRVVPRTPPTNSAPTSPYHGYKTVEEAQAQDGAGVLDILTTFAPQAKDYFEPQTIEQEIEEWKLTLDQISLAKRLAAELHVPNVENPAQMVPKAFQDGEKEEYLPEEYAQDSYGYLGDVLPSEEAKNKWIEQWEEVLNRYQDEVWGGMAHLVKEAKQEIEEAKVEGSEGHEPVALRRLAMVLSHLSRDQFAQRPEAVLELEPVPERPRRPFKHWTKAQELAHREANNLPNTTGTGLDAFQRQLEIMNEQNKKREQISQGDTNNETYPVVGEGEGEGRQWKDAYTCAYNGTVLDSKREREDTARRLDRTFRGW